MNEEKMEVCDVEDGKRVDGERTDGDHSPLRDTSLEMSCDSSQLMASESDVCDSGSKQRQSDTSLVREADKILGSRIEFPVIAQESELASPVVAMEDCTSINSDVEEEPFSEAGEAALNEPLSSCVISDDNADATCSGDDASPSTDTQHISLDTDNQDKDTGCIVLLVDTADDEGDEESPLNRPHPRKKKIRKYVCGHCAWCCDAVCGTCVACQLNADEERCAKLVPDQYSGKLVCMLRQGCPAYKSMIKPRLTKRARREKDAKANDNDPFEALVSLAVAAPEALASEGLLDVFSVQDVMKAVQTLTKLGKQASVSSASDSSRPSQPSSKKYPIIHEKRVSSEGKPPSNQKSPLPARRSALNHSLIKPRNVSRKSAPASPSSESSPPGTEDSAEGEAQSDDELLHATLDDLQHMRQVEIDEALEKGILKSQARIRSEIFSQSFQKKVGKFLTDGGNLKRLSERLDLTIDTLRVWRRQFEQKKIETQHEKIVSKRNRNRSKTYHKLKTERQKYVERKKQALTGNQPEARPTAASGAWSTARPVDHSQYTRTTWGVTSSGPNRIPSIRALYGQEAATPRPSAEWAQSPASRASEDNLFIIYDKGASDISDDDGGFTPDTVAPSFSQQMMPFVCNDCRQIFRHGNLLQSHLFFCQKRTANKPTHP